MIRLFNQSEFNCCQATKNGRRFVPPQSSAAAIELNKIIKELQNNLRLLPNHRISPRTHIFCSAVVPDAVKTKTVGWIWFKLGHLRHTRWYKEPVRHSRGPTQCLRCWRQTRPSCTLLFSDTTDANFQHGKKYWSLAIKAAIKVSSAEADCEWWLLFWLCTPEVYFVATTRQQGVSISVIVPARWCANKIIVAAAADVSPVMDFHTCAP